MENLKLPQPRSYIGEQTVMVRLTHMWRRRGEAVVVFSDAHFNLVRLEFNRVGSRVWELMDGGRSVTAIVDELRREYPNVSGERITAGVIRFLERIRADWLAMSKEEFQTYE